MMNNFFTLVRKIYYNEYLILTFLILFGFLVRLYKINSPVADWHSFRQADTASVSREYVKNGINLLIPKYHDVSRVQSGMFNPHGYRFVEFPIYNAIHAILFKIFGFLSFEVWGRLVSIVASMVSGIAIYLLGKRMYGRDFALISAFLFYFLPFNIFFSRTILPEPLSIMFSVLSLYYLYEYVKWGNPRSLVISAVLVSLGILVKPYAVFYTAPAIYFLWKRDKVKAILRWEVIVYFLIIFLPFFAWRAWMSQFPEGIPFWRWTFNGDGIRFKPAFWNWIFGQRIGNLILGSTMMLPLGMGIISINKKKDFFLWTFLLGLFAYLCIFATANVRHDYYQAIIIPGVCFLVAKGLIVTYSLVRLSKRWVFFVLTVSVVMGLLISAFQVKEFYKINRPEIIEAGKAVDRLTPKDAVVIANYNGDTAFLYQTNRRGWPVVELPIDELIQEGAQFYVSVDYNDQTNEFMKKFETVYRTDDFVILNLLKRI